jgi:DsbC/DsbD-like thiol-disulfide interchange protein
MNRRHFICATGAVLACPQPAWAGGQWKQRLLSAGFDGKAFQLGLGISLASGWKTYWRVPGDGGIPPTIDVSGINIAAVEISHPTPLRHHDESGETIGYWDEVIFPISVKPEDPAKPVTARINAFLGVCQQVCIPVKIDIEKVLLPGIINPGDARIIREWQAKVPAQSAGAFPLAGLAIAEGGLMGELTGKAAIDIFIEPLETSPLYFKAPVFSGTSFRIDVADAQSLAELRGHKVRATTVTASRSLEQVLTVV